jgi:periplasmic protein TonB
MNNWHRSLFASLAFHGALGLVPFGLPGLAPHARTTPLQARLASATPPATVHWNTAKAVSRVEPSRSTAAPKPRVAPVAPTAQDTAPAIAARAAAPTEDLAPTAMRASPSEPTAGAVADARAAEPSVIGAAAPAGAAPPVPVAYADNPPPVYPRFARERGQTGRVLLAVLVGVDGRPRNVALQASSGFALLDKAAQEAVGRWRFVPGQRNGVAVDATVEVPIVFNLAMG